jgi:hypothetical protein
MPRLSDKHIAAIRAAAEDNDQTYGFGDVILLCDELQERRIHEGQHQAVDLGKTTANALMRELLKCVEAENEPLSDADVLALFHALRKYGYFQTTCVVDRSALDKLLKALSTPEQPHLIREIQVTRGLPTADSEPRNPIDQLIVDLRSSENAAD